MSVSLDDMIEKAVEAAVEKRLYVFEYRLSDIAEQLGNASRALVPRDSGAPPEEDYHLTAEDVCGILKPETTTASIPTDNHAETQTEEVAADQEQSAKDQAVDPQANSKTILGAATVGLDGFSGY